MGSFLRRKSSYEHHSAFTTNEMNTLIAIVTLLDIEAINNSCCEFRHDRPKWLSGSELG